ncbi:hypothetical protein Sya03_02580 [Spirilliplanes yamanashiensis]|uniref:DUF4245 domain-containing protein n=2 Tax=Spirilliplanes yamanashiensis TaxID=42233 RepID=A0A8J3Y3C3_9ACTN|nr:hypothetical protein Sya03_02580 [Spirilliplanes yamanashiensis]
MAMSLLVLLVPIAIVVGAQKYLFDGDKPIAVSPAQAIADARASGAFPVAEPGPLPDGWTVTSARFQRPADGATLRLGYVTPDAEPALLVQSSVPADQLLARELGDTAKAGGPVAVDAVSWQRYDSTRGEPALVLREAGRTIVVVGATDEPTLRELAAAVS